MIKPIFTEKTLGLAKSGKYTFKVAIADTKFKIKEEVLKIFGVKVAQVKTITVKTEKRRNNRGIIVKSRGYKKAIVTLKDGKKLDLFEVKN